MLTWSLICQSNATRLSRFLSPSLRKKSLSSEETTLRKKVRILTVQPAFKAPADGEQLMTFAFAGSSRTHPCGNAVIFSLGELWKWETRTVHPLGNGMMGQSGAEVSDQNGRKSINKNYLRSSFEGAGCSKTRQAECSWHSLSLSVVSSILSSAPSEWRFLRITWIDVESWDFILM